MSVNLGAHSEGRVCLSAPLPMTFASGALVTCARDRQSQPFLSLLAIAKVDITSKRNGIWVLKPRLLASLPEIVASDLLQDTPWVYTHRRGTKRRGQVLHLSDQQDSWVASVMLEVVLQHP